MIEFPSLAEVVAAARSTFDRRTSNGGFRIETLARLRAPLAELVASPISEHVAVLGVGAGLRFVHHELRVRSELPAEARPEPELARAEPRPVWQDGALVVPKYAAGRLDAPLPIHDPNHRGQWRPHELLHRLVGFFWAPDMTRFEAYVGARLSELLPVVHWYGFDEIGRRRCSRHRVEPPFRELCRDCESHERGDTAAGWEPERCDAHARAALDHWRREWEAIERELETGRVHAVRHLGVRGGLDASSDALQYMRCHWNRVTAWSFGAWCERFVGQGHQASLDDLARSVADVGIRVSSRSPSDADHDDADTSFDRQAALRRCSDTAYRVLLAIEHRDSDAAEDAVMPGLDELSNAMRSRGAGAADLEARRRLVLDRLERALGSDVAERVAADGWEPGASASNEQLAEGIRHALPVATATADPEELDGVLTASAIVVAEGGGWTCGRLSGRVSGVWAVGLARLEAWLDGVLGRDRLAEDFGVVSQTAARADLRANTTLRRGRFDAGSVRRMLGWDDVPDDEVEVELAAWRMRGELRVVEVEPAVAELLDGIDETVEGRPDETDALPDEAVRALELGLLVYEPRPRR